MHEAHDAADRRPDVSVVVPARDEEVLLPRALDALAVASDRHRTTGADVTVVVVADGCTDRTARRAREAGVIVVETACTNVGAARATGCAVALERHRGRRRPLWLATTDADSVVPPGWIDAQVRAALDGCDLRVGLVDLAPADRVTFPGWVEAYEQEASARSPHGHVHGANLGIGAPVYRALGGFRPLSVGEDVDLVARAVASGAVVDWAHDAPVVTSSRTVGRAPAGVALDLVRSVRARKADPVA